MLIIYFFILFF